ncbi:restriction endonuclease subunit S [Lactococcus cremoris]|jgi:type I restriction enzyme, S subunit|uniref:restriction endonuclease subunit S n=4 Tax=Lactococcus lactis subsp. cremoris TaxID=1359 RepID=UPI00117AAAF8|nr:restriction endonuclease subunit S [Lactococcus cremoris]TRW52605.1 restriction endonuclease subunit S [Lactococcus lactis]MCT0452335.1 restriction endonuclease subunit S [Lactococcus cremoris]MCT0502798.1 restriction endonuclease subunit S [Lactococcus cremoris]MCT0506823.1 restriction endonuclease subunit S [Lactococcus cremoris]
MMSKKSPQLRFEGFTDDWEERKLSDVANHRGGTAIEKYFDKDGVYKVISIGSYGLNSQYVDQNIRAISNEITDGRVVNSGELTMVLNDKTANGTIIGRTLLVEKDNEYVINQRTEIISPKENFDSNFAYTILNGPFREKVKRIVQGGTQIYVNYPAVSNLNLELPKIEEQQKIGSFFKQLDDTIALHQRKLDLLKEQKKGYLQKMFPKNGAKVPELRFAGFVDDWEQRKLSDLMTFSNGINAPKENYGKGTKMISVMDILNPLPIKYDNILNSVSVDKKIEDKNKVENGDLIFVRSSEIVEEVGWAKAYKEARYALYSGFAIRGKRISSYNAYFIELTLNYANRKEIKRRAGGSTRFNVSQEILNSLTVLTPSISEQNQIDLFFTKIDDTITLHQRKLDLLKEQKKGFLQKMFV